MTRNRLKILLTMAVLAVTTSSAQADIVPDLLDYHMDEASWNGTAGEVIDSSAGTKYHGTAMGGATTVADGHFGRVGTFDRIDDYVDCGTDITLAPTAGITLEACIKLASSGDSTVWKDSRSILSRAGSYFFEVRNHTDGKGRLAVYLYGAGGRLIAETVDMADYIDSWIHVAATYDGSEKIIYINGSEVASMASTGSIACMTMPTQVGWSTYGCFFDGEMAHVGIYSDALTPDQVEERYNLMMVSDLIAGDANGDGTVDGEDAALLAANWQTATGATWGMGDFNNDGAVDDIDATLLASNWQTITSASVPEPGTLALLAGVLTSGLLLIRRRK